MQYLLMVGWLMILAYRRQVQQKQREIGLRIEKAQTLTLKPMGFWYL